MADGVSIADAARGVLDELVRPGRCLVWYPAERVGAVCMRHRGALEPVAPVTRAAFLWLWRMGALTEAPGGRRHRKWTISARGTAMAGGGGS